MALWWAGAIVLLVVVVPVVALILHLLLRPALQIKAYADDVAQNAALFGPHLAAAMNELTGTERLVAELRVDLERYSQTLERLS